jgi:hypothetical protein
VLVIEAGVTNMPFRASTEQRSRTTSPSPARMLQNGMVVAWIRPTSWLPGIEEFDADPMVQDGLVM